MVGENQKKIFWCNKKKIFFSTTKINSFKKDREEKPKAKTKKKLSADSRVVFHFSFLE
jgi:hypothetical protein